VAGVLLSGQRMNQKNISTQVSIKTISTPENLQVLYEDNHLIAINKRAGDIVQGDKTGDTPLSEVVKQFLKTKHNKPGNVYLGVAHRLDRPTTGIVVFAKTSKALLRLNKLFAEKDARKTYWAVVNKMPDKEEDTLTHWLKRNPKQNKSYGHIKEVPESKKAILDYKVIKSLDRYFLLEIDLKTGRHHQIRAQLAAIGCVIKGDLKYGGDRSNKDGSIHLHARSLSFIHPVKKEMLQLIAPPPEDNIWNACL
jgi:23S rRNA pseudouridine1911/1915/1917 synthase